jgi:hypothetical protein
MLRRVFQFSLLALLALAPSSVRAAVASGSVEVTAVQSTRVADLVLLNGGFEANLRSGMVCRITRGSIDVAEVLLVEVRPSSSAALIVSLAPKQSIRAGDLARVKILKT